MDHRPESRSRKRAVLPRQSVRSVLAVEAPDTADLHAGGRGDGGHGGDEGGVRFDGRWATCFAGRFNGGEPVKVGGILGSLIDEMSRKAAGVIAESGEPLAITVEPDGAVCVEPVISADVGDLVGVYALDGCEFRLKARIRADLLAERSARRGNPRRVQRDSTVKRFRMIVADVSEARGRLTWHQVVDRYGISRSAAMRVLAQARRAA